MCSTLTISEDEEELTLLVKNINVYLKNERGVKEMKATTWDSNSESEADSAHMCFIVQGNDPLDQNLTLRK